MFRIITTSKLKYLKDEAEFWEGSRNTWRDMAIRYKQKIEILEERIESLKNENDRLFNYHNDRLTKPKPDKAGKLRHKDGTFARAK